MIGVDIGIEALQWFAVDEDIEQGSVGVLGDGEVDDVFLLRLVLCCDSDSGLLAVFIHLHLVGSRRVAGGGSDLWQLGSASR